MKIVVIAPSKIDYLAKTLNKTEDEIKEMFTEIVKVLIKNDMEIVITPDKNSPLEFVGKEYLKLKGKKLFEVIPTEDTEFGYKEWVNDELGEIISCKTWRNQPETTNEVTDLLICLGYGVGVTIEICYTKWFKSKPVFIIKELVSSELPDEINESLDIRYISINELDEKLRNLK